MNISIITACKPAADSPYGELAAVLAKTLNDKETAVNAGVSPDIVHLFGSYDTATLKRLQWCRRHKVPTVLTIRDGLAAFTRGKRAPHASGRGLTGRVLAAASAVHATGYEEEEFIKAACKDATVCTIPNSCVTSLIDAPAMAGRFRRLYAETMQANERQVSDAINTVIRKAHVEQPELRDITHALLYTEYLNNRGLLDDGCLRSFALLLITTNYDEDLLAGILNAIGSHGYLATLLKLLETRGLITEGFMPVCAAATPLTLYTMSTPGKLETRHARQEPEQEQDSRQEPRT